MNQPLGTARRGEDSDGVSDSKSPVVIAVQVHGAVGHRFACRASEAYLRSRLRFRFAQRLSLAPPPNNRFERSRGRVFGGLWRGSMIETKQLRWSPAQPRVAQPYR
jgi:hypothetical protein